MCNRDIYAHRGASADRFENTMDAFTEALRQQADGLEIDIQLSKDSVPIVIHDRNLSRLAGRDRNVDDLNIRSIKRVRLGTSWWQRRFRPHLIPTLKEVVHFCEVQHVKLNVELKETVAARPEQIRHIVELLRPVRDVHISSFHYDTLLEVKRIDPTIETAFLLKKNILKERQLHHYEAVDAYHLNVRLWTKNNRSYIESFQKPVRLYDVMKDEALIRDPSELIVGWITDYPEALRRRASSQR